MKLLLGVLVLIWLICGVAGAWRLGDLDRDHWKTVARGPLTLVEAFHDDPVAIPGP